MAYGEKAGTCGIGHTGTTKYGAESAKVEQYGGNEHIEDGIESNVSPASMYGGDSGSLGKAKGK